MMSFNTFGQRKLNILLLTLIFISISFSCKKDEQIKIDEKPVEQLLVPVVTSILPLAGPAGTDVTLTGLNFSTTLTDNKVTFNGADAVVKTATATTLVVTAPAAGSSGAVLVKVKNNAAINTLTFTYGVFPLAISLSPATVKAGDKLTITGTNFSNVVAENDVSFNTGGIAGVRAVILSATTTQLVVEVPAAAVTGNVLVTSKGFTSVKVLTVEVTPTAATGNISLFLPQNSNGVEKFVVDARGNFYASFNTGTFTVSDASGTVKKTFTKADFNNHSGGLVALGLDGKGNAYAAWNRNSGSKSWTTFYRIKSDFSSEIIGTEIAPSLGSITPNRNFVVDSKNDIYYTDTYSIFKIENSTIDLTKRYLDGRAHPATPLFVDLTIDENDNLYVLTRQNTTGNQNIQTIVKYDAAKAATKLFSVATTTLDQANVNTVPESTVGEFKAFFHTPEGSFYVGDYDGNRIRKITGDNKTEVVAGSGEYGRAFNGYVLTGEKLATPLPRPFNLGYDPVNKVVYSEPNAYDKGRFVQAFKL
ncbi:MAG: hypothetical protein EOO88_01745 [Pedobacter sp.]|nr:MAG: hypothetical protein EOO88_01745 [Pedobacter sp.]